VKRRIEAAAHDLGTYEPDGAAGAARDVRLLSMFPGASLDPLVARWREIGDPAARKRLDDAFRGAAGEGIEDFSDRMND
jgi:hypothetical protein